MMKLFLGSLPSELFRRLAWGPRTGQWAIHDLTRLVVSLLFAACYLLSYLLSVDRVDRFAVCCLLSVVVNLQFVSE